MTKLADFSRQTWNSEHRNLRGKLDGKEIKIELKSVKNRPILAWHLEVWGHDKKLISKEQNLASLNGRKVGKNWWKRH